MSATTSAPKLRLEKVVKRFGAVEVLRGVSLEVSDAEFLTVLGPSGSGKTTMLRLIAGFSTPTSGRILLGGKDVSTLPPGQRGVGMVFQQYALFPHMNVAENIGYGLRRRGWARARRAAKVEEMLTVVGLEGRGDQLPRQLSGGQQQRVALARALAFGPELLLMDEPLGALDRELRVRMAGELRRIHSETGATVVYVTHDREEALTLSDRIALMHDGAIDSIDTPSALFERPTSAFAAGFFGGHNLLACTWRGPESPESGRAEVECLGQRVVVAAPSTTARTGRMQLSLPAHALSLDDAGTRSLVVAGIVDSAVYLGEVVQISLVLDDDPAQVVYARVPAAKGLPARGSRLSLFAELGACVVVER